MSRVEALFAGIQESKTENLKGNFKIEVKKEGKTAATFVVRVAHLAFEARKVEGDDNREYDVVISIEDDVLVDLLSGKVDEMEAFMGGKIVADGDIGLALQATQLMKALGVKDLAAAAVKAKL